MPYDAPSPALLDLPEIRLTGAAPALELPSWHAARPHLVATALSEARLAAPHLAALAARSIPRMPRRPLASQTIRAITRDRSSSPMLLPDAITCPWVAYDSATHRNAAMIDVDHEDALDRWLAIPEHVRPTLVLDPWSGRAHAIASFEDPVLLKTHEEIEAERTGGKAQKQALLGPQMMADLAGRLLAAALGGTLMPPGSLAKNPWGLSKNLIGSRRKLGPRPVFPEHWEVIQARGLMWTTFPGAGPVKLRDLVRALADQWWHETAGASPRFSTKRYAKKRGDPSWLSRNTWIFDLTRWWAYDHEERDGGAILETATRFNAELAEPLPLSDVRATARSIARFMTTRYRPRYGAGDRRGRDAEAGAGLSTAEKLMIAGQRSGAQRAGKTDAQIAEAIAKLQAAGMPVTQGAVMAETGLGERTIRRRWNRPIGALSGSAAAGRPGAPQGTPSSRINESDSSLAEVAVADRRRRREAVARERERARLLAALASAEATARRRGAEPPRLPAVPAGLRTDPEIRSALRSAEAAAADARRRHAARVARENAASRRAGMVDRLRQNPAEAWSWWRRRMSDHDDRWDLVIHSADPADLPDLTLRRRREAAAAWSMWRAATREARRDLDPRQPDRIDLAVPW